MIVLLIGRTKIHKTYLPTDISGNYSIKDTKGKKLLTIEATNEGWKIESNNYVKIVNPNSIKIEIDRIVARINGDSLIPSIIIEENNMYAICLGDSKEVYTLYCVSDEENKLRHMNLKNTQRITIGSAKDNNISYNNFFVSDKHAEIIKKDGKWIIKNYNMHCGTFVNNEPIYEDIKTLSNGDIIFIMGLKIMLLKDSIYINNPQNNVVLDDTYFELSNDENEPLIDDDNNSEVEIVSEENYYNRSPRMLNLIKTEEVKIDEPPTRSDGQQKPTLLLLGSSLAMGIVAILSLSTAIQGIVNGTATFASTFVSFMYAISMIVAMIVIPLLNIKYDKKIREKNERKRQKKYKEYLEKKQETIDKIRVNQREKLYKNNISAEECENIILTNNHRLWERKIDEDDFLTIRLGISDVPLNIDIKYPEEKFTMEDDNLLDMVRELVDNSKTIKDAPITVSLLQNKVISVIEKCTPLFTDLFMKNIILQLVTLQSYEDLNLVFLVKDSQRWEYVKMLPHAWNSSKQIRFFADNYYDMNEVSKYLEEELKNRKLEEEDTFRDDVVTKPHYLIITDDYQQIESLKAITEILKTKGKYAFTLMCITDDIFKLPNECEMFISIDRYRGTLFENTNSLESQKEFVLDDFYDIQYNKVVQKLANISIKMKNSEKTSMLPTNYSFLEMFEVGNIESLNILDRWKSNDSTMSLRTPIGIDENGRTISLDIHEKYHGPHGLIAGSTGSGKSEFIITYILSLAINYHPDDVTFLLIDYKGGGLAGAFETKDYRLPHLVGTITNIDTNGLQRSLISIQSELKRRQILFNKARALTNEGTIDIYKYQRLYHEGIVKQPIPHLLIICDEFAELKQQQGEFMDELISVSRIGRSLGVHLVLATQKPAGIVNDQIRSNSKFAVCLKVQEKSDSQDVIKKSDAAFLKNTGQFYLQVGNHEYYVLGQVAWAGAQYTPSNTIQKKVDTSVEFISNIGEPIKRVDDVLKQNVNSQGEQLTNIVRYISDLANKESLKKDNNLWLEDIPQDIYIGDLRVKYSVKESSDDIEAVIGEYDDPSNQKQGLVKINLFDKENINIYGNAESGKETLLSTMIYDLMTNYSSEEVQFYILDFGSEVLKVFKNSPHVGDVIFSRDEEKVSRFFDMIRKEIKARKVILSDYNGDYNLYLSKGNVMPIIMVVLNNYEVFQENYGVKYDDIFSTITRDCTKYGIIFTTTVNSVMSMRYRLNQNFSRKLVLQLSNSDEYLNIFNKLIKKKPSNDLVIIRKFLNFKLQEFVDIKILMYV